MQNPTYPFMKTGLQYANMNGDIQFLRMMVEAVALNNIDQSEPEHIDAKTMVTEEHCFGIGFIAMTMGANHSSRKAFGINPDGYQITAICCCFAKSNVGPYHFNKNVMDYRKGYLGLKNILRKGLDSKTEKVFENGQVKSIARVWSRNNTWWMALI